VLNGSLEIEGLDVEPFVDRVVTATLRKNNIVLSVHRREDLVAYVISEVWVASRNYDSGRYKSFSQVAGAVAVRKVVDWVRGDIGRSRWSFGTYTYERKRPEFVSLDADAGRDRLVGALERGASGREDWSPSLRRLLAG
jgi:hypothetical protein